MDWQSVLKYNPNHDPKDGRFTFAGHGLAGAPGKSTGGFAAEKNKAYRERQAAEGLIADEYKSLSSLAIELRLTEKYAAKHGQVYNLKDGIPFEMREVASAIDNLAAEYPDHFAKLIGVAISESGSAVRMGAWAEMDGQGRMFLNPNMWGVKQAAAVQREGALDARSALRNNLPHQLQESVGVNFHPPGTNSIKSIIDHEFGHHFMNTEAGAVGRQGKRGFGLLSMELQSILKSTDKKKPLLGDYSTVSQSEWFACAFAFAHGSSKDPRAKQAREAIRLYLTDYRKFVTEQQARLLRKSDLAQTDLDQAGRLPPTQGPKRKRRGFKRMFQYGEGLVTHVTKANPYHDPKNGRFTTKAMGFMQEWQEGTQPHPFDDRTRLRRYVGVEMSPWPGLDTVHMSSIISYGSKGKGEASQVLSEITQMADERGITLDLTAKPIPGAGAEGKSLTKAQLIKWYKRHGFEQEKYALGPGLSDRMVRKPRTPTQKYNKNHDPKTGRFTTANGGLPDVDTFIKLDQYSRERALAKLSLKDVDRLLSKVSIEEAAFNEKLAATDAKVLEVDDQARVREFYQARIAIVDHYNKREVQAEVEEAINTVPHFFHGTFTEALTSIAENGISNTPKVRQHDISYYSGDRGKSVYMVTDVQSAIRWGQVASINSTHGAVVLKVRVPKEERAKIVQDESFPYSAKTFRIPRHIPPEWIESYATVPKEVMFDAAGNPKATLGWQPLPQRKQATDDTEGVFYVVVGIGELQTSAKSAAASVSKKNQFSTILKFNPYHDDHGKFTSAQNAGQQSGHDELPTVDAMNRAMQLVGMEQFERAVVEHLDTLKRPVFGLEQAYEIERVARRIVAEHRNTVAKCDFSMPWQYFMEVGDAYRTFKYSDSGTFDPRETHLSKFDESKHPREPAGTPKGGQFAAWRQGTGMYFDDKVWRYGGDHSEVPANVSARLKAMAIPPASINVHLNPNADEPLQATWTAKNGKLQYRYSAEATGSNAAEKFSRLKDFNAAMPLLRRRSHDDLLQGKTQAERDTAAVVRLMAKTGFRVGGENEFETRKGKAYGASTLLDKHVVVNGNKLTFSFPGKHAVMQNHELTDVMLAQYIRNRKRHTTTKEERLFATNEGRVNKYLKDVTGQPFSAKDFRTWHGTHTALTVLKEIGDITTEAEYRKARIRVGDEVAKKLGNTRNVALGSYIDPTVWGRWVGKEKKRKA